MVKSPKFGIPPVTRKQARPHLKTGSGDGWAGDPKSPAGLATSALIVEREKLSVYTLRGRSSAQSGRFVGDTTILRQRIRAISRFISTSTSGSRGSSSSRPRKSHRSVISSPLATHHLPDGDLISATSGSFDGHLAFITAPGEEDLWWIQRLGFWLFHHCRLWV